MTRKLKTFACLSPGQKSGTFLVDPLMRRCYDALKSIGFLETRWQYVYEGQLAGLVFPHNGGRNEIHVRFYHDRVFAEYEIGRAYLSHFVGPRYNASEYVRGLLRAHVDSSAWMELVDLTEVSRCLDDEAAMPAWNPGLVGTDPFDRQRRGELMLGVIALAGLEFGWKALFVILGTSLTALIFVITQNLAWSAVSATSCFAVWRTLPSRGRP